MIKKNSLHSRRTSTIAGFLRRTLLLSGAATLTALAPALAQEEPDSFFDDFESYGDYEAPGHPWSTTALATAFSWIETDWSNLLGHGPENKFLNWNKHSIGAAEYLALLNQVSIEIGRVSFDFYQPDDGSEDAIWFFLYAGNRHNDNRALYLDVGVGGKTIGNKTYGRNTTNQLEIIFNNSDDPVIYGDDILLMPGSSDIYLNGELAASNFSRHNNRRGPVTGFEFNSRGNGIHQFYFDNFVMEPIDWEIPPPEAAPEPQIIFHEDFATHTPGNIPGAPWTSVTDDVTKTGSARIQSDTGDLFGKGTENQFMEYLANGDGPILARSQNSFSSDLITFSFNLIDPTPETTGYSWIIFNVGNASGTGNRAQVITLDNRITETSRPGYSRIAGAHYRQNVPVRIDLVINNSPNPVEYGDGLTIESGTTDVWINGRLGTSGFANQNHKRGPISTFEFNVSGSQKQRLLIDEITIYDSVRISEPTGEPDSGFTSWREIHFPADADDDSISGPAANPTGDGVSNLIKYLLGLDPNSVSRENLPLPEISEIDGDGYLTLTFTRQNEADDVTFKVVATGDLSNWENAILTGSTDNGDGTTTETWRDTRPISGAKARFLQIEASLD